MKYEQVLLRIIIEYLPLEAKAFIIDMFSEN